MSLRARLLTVVVSLTAVGLIVAGIATYASLRSFLVDRVDRTVTAGAQTIERSLGRGRPGPGAFDALGEANPGIYLTSSLGITFPFMLILGVPIIYQIALFWQSVLL